MFVVICLFLAKRTVYKFVAPCIAWIAQRRRNWSALACSIYERLVSLFIVCKTMFTIGDSRSISKTTERERQAQDNVTFNRWLGILAGEDLPSKL